MSNLTEVTTPHQHRMRIRRKCVSVIRSCLDAVPQLGDPYPFLLNDGAALDAVITLNALGVRPEDAALYINHDRYSERLHIRLLAVHVRQSLNLIIQECSNGK